MTAKEKRQKVADTYKTILGRNLYSQKLRSYCFTKYSNGKYYSDCSSSVTYSYQKAGYGFGILNTVGIYKSTKLQDVAVKISKGVIQNPDVLRVGDMLLFAGTDTGRAAYGYVGHVEMVYKISSSGTVTLCGHGSGTPRTTELNAYCKSRYSKKTSTKLGNKGLIRVRRLIPDDGAQGKPEDMSMEEDAMVSKIKVTGGTVNLRKGAGTQYEADGVAKKGEVLEVIRAKDGWIPVLVDGKLRWISEKYAQGLE